MLKVDLVVSDGAGNEIFRLVGPELPAKMLIEPRMATPGVDLVLDAFTRMFGFSRTP